MHLGDLTIETAKPFEGTTFTLTLPDGVTTTMKLDEVREYAMNQRRRKATPKRAPFSLFFLGEPAMVLPQAMYTLSSEALTLTNIFLVPLSRDDEATEYEAVFT